MKKTFCLAIILFTLNSCILFDNGSRTIVDDYKLEWIDLPSNQYITFADKTLVEGYVYAVGFDDEFIIAKQHPNNGFDGGYKVNTSITNYFIIKRNTKDKTIGPLTRSEFKMYVKRFAISNIEFTINDIEKP